MRNKEFTVCVFIAFISCTWLGDVTEKRQRIAVFNIEKGRFTVCRIISRFNLIEEYT